MCQAICWGFIRKQYAALSSRSLQWDLEKLLKKSGTLSKTYPNYSLYISRKIVPKKNLVASSLGPFHELPSPPWAQTLTLMPLNGGALLDPHRPAHCEELLPPRSRCLRNAVSFNPPSSLPFPMKKLNRRAVSLMLLLETWAKMNKNLIPEPDSVKSVGRKELALLLGLSSRAPAWGPIL